MTLKSIGVAICIILICIAIAYFYSERRYVKGFNDGVRSITLDSTITLIDTVEVTDTIEIRYYKEIEAEIDTVDDALVYSTSIDTSVVIKEDTVATLITDVVFTEGIFKIISKIDVFPVEKLITTERTVYQTQVKEVAVSKFPNTFLTGFGTALVGVLIAIILLL